MKHFAHQEAPCSFCNGPMWLRSVRLGKLMISWGNSHHRAAPCHGYQPFGLGPWLLIDWSPPGSTMIGGPR